MAAQTTTNDSTPTFLIPISMIDSPTENFGKWEQININVKRV
jgi:hypothetical protein